MGPRLVSKKDHSEKTGLGAFVFYPGERPIRPTEAPFWLLDFASPFEKDDTVIDLGTGTGIIPLLIALRSEVQVIVACEVSREAARIARKNISSNKLSDRITLRTCDYRELAFFYPEGSFSVVVSNPPFMKKDSARISPLDERALSRYELKGSLKELLHVSAHLAGKAGRLLYIYPTKRFNEMMEGLSRVGFAAVRLKFIHTAPHRPARFFMVEAARSAGREG